MLTFAFVRHPFDRIVSAYFDQMIDRPNWPVRKVIVEQVIFCRRNLSSKVRRVTVVTFSQQRLQPGLKIHTQL
jgi:hypothetical protein